MLLCLNDTFKAKKYNSMPLLTPVKMIKWHQLKKMSTKKCAQSEN